MIRVCLVELNIVVFILGIFFKLHFHFSTLVVQIMCNWVSVFPCVFMMGFSFAEVHDKIIVFSRFE